MPRHVFLTTLPPRIAPQSIQKARAGVYISAGFSLSKSIPLTTSEELPLPPAHLESAPPAQEHGSSVSGVCVGPTMIADRVWHLYVLQCADGSLYCGIALDTEKRLAQHQSGKGAKYTRSRLPVILLQSTAIGPEMAEALKAERRFKALTRSKKIATLRDHFTPSGPPIPSYPNSQA